MRKFIFILFALAISTSLYAQRTSPGSYFIEAQIATSFTSGGASVNAGQYSQIGFWRAGIAFTDYALISQLDTKYSYSHLVAQGEYLFRIVGSRNRRFSLYGGAGIFLGGEFSDPFHKLSTSEPSKLVDKFLYGAYPALEFEGYITDNISMYLDGVVPLNCNSQVQVATPRVGLGVRYCF